MIGVPTDWVGTILPGESFLTGKVRLLYFFSFQSSLITGSLSRVVMEQQSKSISQMNYEKLGHIEIGPYCSCGFDTFLKTIF